MLQMTKGDLCQVTQDIPYGRLTIERGTRLIYEGEWPDDHSTTGISFRFHLQKNPKRTFDIFGFKVEESIVVL